MKKKPFVTKEQLEEIVKKYPGCAGADRVR